MAETNGLLNRRTGKSGTEGSNPSASATFVITPVRGRSQIIDFLRLNRFPKARRVHVRPQASALIHGTVHGIGPVVHGIGGERA